jgi:4-hydroxy-2-oxoheptanedioate aldolase
VWTNALKERLAAGHVVVGAVLTEFPSPDVAEFCARLGFDFVFIDAEHGGVTPLLARDMVRAVLVGGATPLVRVPVNEPTVIQAYLDAGAHGIVAPHVNTAADAEALVRAVKFPPRGRRGAAATTRAANFGLTQTPADYVRAADRETLVMPLLEEARALDELDALLRVDGVDVYQIGYGDLALGLGLEYYDPPWNPTTARLVSDAIRRIVAAGKTAGTTAHSAAHVREMAVLGARVFIVGFAGLARGAVQEFLAAARG